MKNIMTREEKRRLLFNKKYEKKQRKFENRRTKVMFRNRILVTVLAVVFALSGMVTVLVSALDGKGYEDITTVIFDNTNSYTVPEEGIARGTWFKYSRDNKQYVFQAEYDLIPGDTLTLMDNDTIDIFHDPTGGDTQHLYDLLTYADLTSSNPYTFSLKQGTATYDEDGNVVGYTDNVLKSGQRYYYTPDGITYYSFIPSEDVGYEWIETREQGVYTQKTLGDLTITIDPNSAEEDYRFSVVGNKYTRKVIYERTDRLLENHVYLITAAEIAGAQEHMLSYGATKDDKKWIRIWDNRSGLLTHNCPSWYHENDRAYNFEDPYSPWGLTNTDGRGEYVYEETARDVTQVTSAPEETQLTPTLIVNSPTTEAMRFYDYNANGAGSLSDKMVATQHHYYFDGADGSLPTDSNKNSTNDIYVLSEFSTYTRNIKNTFGNFLASLTGAERGGTLLMAYDWDGSSYTRDNTTVNPSIRGYYTSGKALGSQYSLSSEPAAQLLIHELCSETSASISHAFGGLWHYDSSNLALYNSNSKFLNAAPRFLDYDLSYHTEAYGDYNSSTYVPYHLVNSQNSRNAKATYIYEMKDVYTHQSINQHRSIVAETKGHATIGAIELEDVTVTLSYDGADTQKTFPVTFTLIDEDGNLVSGKWSTDTLTFTDGVYTTTMKKGDSVPFTNIPKGYSLNISVALPNGDGDENALYYSSTIDGQAVSEKDVDIDSDRIGNNAIPIVITDTRKKATISLTYKGDNITDPNQAFPVTLKLTESDGTTPVSGTFLGKDTTGATTYVFNENGECIIDPMSDNQSLDVYVPKGYKLTTTVFLPTQGANYYTSSVDGVDGNTATVTLNADEDIPIVITSVKERVTVTNITSDNLNQPGYSDSSREFPLKLTLYNADGTTPYSGEFMGTDGTTVYTFGQDGVCTNTVELADQESISLFLPKNTVLKVEDAETASGYTTTYSDPTENDSSTPLNTSISNDGIQITVNHTADEIVITGLLEESETQGLAIGGAVAGVGLAAGAAYVYCKKDEII